MSIEGNKSVVRRFCDEAINRKNLAVLEEIVAADFVGHVPFPGQGPGREGLRFALELFFRGFPDLAWTTHEQIAEGDTVVSRFSWTGTQRGEFLGIPPSNRRVNVSG